MEVSHRYPPSVINIVNVVHHKAGKQFPPQWAQKFSFFVVVLEQLPRHIFHETLLCIHYNNRTIHPLVMWVCRASMKGNFGNKKKDLASVNSVDVMPTHACISSGRIHAPSCQKSCDSMQNFLHEDGTSGLFFSVLPSQEFMLFDVIVDDSRNRLQFQVFFFIARSQMAHLCLEIRNCEITARVELLLFLHFSFYIIVIMAHGNINYNKNNNNSSDDPAVLLSTL